MSVCNNPTYTTAQPQLQCVKIPIAIVSKPRENELVVVQFFVYPASHNSNIRIVIGKLVQPLWAADNIGKHHSLWIHPIRVYQTIQGRATASSASQHWITEYDVHVLDTRRQFGAAVYRLFI